MPAFERANGRAKIDRPFKMTSSRPSCERSRLGGLQIRSYLGGLKTHKQHRQYSPDTHDATLEVVGGHDIGGLLWPFSVGCHRLVPAWFE